MRRVAMDNSKLLSLCACPAVVVVGIPECWVDARRVTRLLRWQPANDNERRYVVAGAAE